LSGLIFIGLVAPSSGKSNQPASVVSIGEVLRAHNVPRDPDLLLASVAEAVKLTSYTDAHDSNSPGFFERKIKVSIGVGGFKRHKTDVLGLREEFDLFDGRNAHQSVVETGKKAKEVDQMSDSRFRAVAFGVNTFGLVPILNQLSAQRAEVNYLGRTARGEDMFELRMATGSWTLYTDQQHMIRKLERGNRTIKYADYRSVDGVRLPFIQRVYIEGRLAYELVFKRIDLNQTFPAGYFSREALSKEILP
jgi:hypothetical protein